MEEEERSTDSLYFTIESIGVLILHVGWDYTMNYWSCSVLDENDSQFVRRIFRCF